MKSWPSEWFAKDKKSAAEFVVEDIKLRQYIDKKFNNAGIAKMIIRKTGVDIELIIFTSKIGPFMGKNGEKVKELETDLSTKFGKIVKVTLKEVRIPELSAKIMAEYIANQLENRMPFRKVAKNVLQKVMEKGAEGIKIQV